jgi:hypothetical protein
MYKYILEAAGNINWMALSALLTFMFVFVVSAILILTKNTETIKHISELPLGDDQVNANN